MLRRSRCVLIFLLKKIIGGAWVNTKMSERNPCTVILYIHNNYHRAGTPTKRSNNYKRHDKVGYSSICYIGSCLSLAILKCVL